MSRILWSSALIGAAVLGAAASAVIRPGSGVRVVTVTEVRSVPAPVERVAAPAAPRVRAQPSRPRQAPAVAHAARQAKHHAVRPRPAKPHRKAAKLPVARVTTRLKVTPSLYERTTSPPVLQEQGCRAGKAGTHGIVILDFGKPAYRRGGYGTLTFADRFASNTSITWALKAYATGYARCLSTRSAAKIVLARGTSNFGIDVPSPAAAGRKWATETSALAAFLRRHHLDDHIEAAAADDVEPAWDRSFKRTYSFFSGFRAAHRGVLLYNYGSLDGGVGAIWNVRQAYYVTGGMRYARALPEIYNERMASEWAELSRIVVERFGTPLSFAGIMTQYRHRCRKCGFSGREAHRALVRELSKHPRTRIRKLAAVTNIVSAPLYARA